MSYHTVILVGNVGRDPEMRYLPSGQPVTTFSIASNRQYTGNNGEKVKETIWFRVTTWGKQAENCNQYLKKGSKVLVEGRLTPDKETGGPRIWTPQDSETPKASYEINAATVQFLSTPQGAQAGQGEAGDGSSFIGAPDDDIPF